MEEPTPIAIVGLAYRLPDCGRKGLFEYLADARSAFSGVPPTRFSHEAFYHPNAEKQGCYSSKGGHFLKEDIFAFDAGFFSLRAEEARVMDPQVRSCPSDHASEALTTFLSTVYCWNARGKQPKAQA